jgi:hypothetical protein
MPVILRIGPYEVYFYSHEPNEPPHVHVDRDDLSAKFWLQPVALARRSDFSSRELRRIERILNDHEQKLVAAWHRHFGTASR